MPKRGISYTQLDPKDGSPGMTTGPLGVGLVTGNYFCPYLPNGSFASASPNQTADQLKAWPFVLGFDVKIDGLGLEVITANTGAECRIGIWQSNGTNRGPGSLLVDSGVLDCATTGFKTGTIATTTIKRNHVYWVGYNTNQSSGTWGARSHGTEVLRSIRWEASGTLQTQNRYMVRQTSVTYGALPNFGSFDLVNQNPFGILARVA